MEETVIHENIQEVTLASLPISGFASSGMQDDNNVGSSSSSMFIPPIEVVTKQKKKKSKLHYNAEANPGTESKCVVRREIKAPKYQNDYFTGSVPNLKNLPIKHSKKKNIESPIVADIKSSKKLGKKKFKSNNPTCVIGNKNNVGKFANKATEITSSLNTSSANASDIKEKKSLKIKSIQWDAEEKLIAKALRQANDINATVPEPSTSIGCPLNDPVLVTDLSDAVRIGIKENSSRTALLESERTRFIGLV